MEQRTIKIIYWIVTILFALFMLFSGISELMRTEKANEVLIQLGYPVYLNTILGIAKILGAVAILQTKFRTIKEWAYAGFSIDMIGASLSFALNGSGILVSLSPLVFLAVMFVSYALGKKVEQI